MTLLHTHAHFFCLVYAKYQKASVKALVQVNFLMYALSKHKHNPYLKGNRKMAKFTMSKINILASNFFTRMFSVSILCKQSIRLFQQRLQVDFPAYALSLYKQNPFEIILIKFDEMPSLPARY